ncbi:MAG TPA: hypothetical protein VHI30_04130 [Gaiellales bacterium]|nr:hypothetical protein [Gaiellales bacterium]
MGFVSNVAVDRLSDRLAGTTERAISTVVEKRGPAIVRAAERLRAEHPGRSPAELARLAIARSARRVAGTGAVSALPATLPGAGTVVELGAALGDASLLTVAQTELVVLLAHLYGRPVDDVAARRMDVLMAMGVEAGVVDLRRNGTIRVMGTTHRDGELTGEAGAKLTKRISRRLAAQVAGKLARRRAYVILGRELPVVGVGLAAGYNLWSTRKLGHAARSYFHHVA